MNSPRAGGLRGLGKWLRVSLFFPLLLAPLSAAAAPRKPAAGKTRTQQADSLPGEPQKTAPDLLLKKEDERKGDALAAFGRGIIAEDAADMEKAIEVYQKALALDPGYAELAVKIAFELARRGDPSAGIEILKDSIKAAPKEAVSYLYLSQLYDKYLKKPDLALKYAQQALELGPENFTCYLALYELYAVAGEKKKAEGVMERAAKLDNDDPQFWLQLGDFYARLAIKDETPPKLDEAEVQRMNGVYQKALAKAGDDPAILTKIADYYVLSRQIKDAIPLYLKVVGLKHGNSDPSFAAVQDKLAKSFRANGQRDEAIAVLEQLIKDNPIRYETYELLGELYDEKGDPERALANYRQTLLLDSGNPLNYLLVADLFLKTKQFDKAIETLKDARGKFRQVPQLTYSLAIALSQAKQHQEALTAFEQALHEAENSAAQLLNGRFFFNYGAAAEQGGLIDKAVELLKKAIEDPETAAQACNYLGYMWVDKGEHLDEGGDYIKRALALEPENPAFIDSLGWWYFKKGETEKAVEELKKAVAAIQPEDAVVFEHLGDAYGKLNNVSQALVFWQKAAALEPENRQGLAEKIENAKQKVARTPAPAPDAPQN